MKIIKFTKNMSCDNSLTCSDNIVTKLESKFTGIKLMNTNQNRYGSWWYSHEGTKFART